MSANALFQAATVLIFALHAGALWDAIRASRLTGLVSLNAAMAVAILCYGASRWHELLREPTDFAWLLLLTFEAIVLLTAVLTRPHRRLTAWLSSTMFALHGSASVLAVAFAFTFRLRRLM